MPHREISSIFFGGGTPSLMPPATVAALIDAAAGHWRFADDVEITLEANPSSVEAARFADLAAAGVNRVSLGVQALDDAALRFLGRAHGVDEALAALDTAQAHFARSSFDLIYARPAQSLEDWDAELARALGFGTGHLSLYQLTVEPGTRFATLAAQGELDLPDADTSADLYALTQDRTRAAGLPAYEVSNHARPGEASRHNLAYWRYRDYLGVGPGAHGRRAGTATVRHKKPENWLARVAAQGHGLSEETPLPGPDRAVEAVMMGLRLAEGIDLARIAGESGVADPVAPAALARLETFGLIRRDGDRIAATAAGMPVLNALLGELLA